MGTMENEDTAGKMGKITTPMNRAHAHTDLGCMYAPGWVRVRMCVCVWILLFFCAQWIESIKQGGTLCSKYSSIYHFPMGRSRTRMTTTAEATVNQRRGCRIEWKILRKRKQTSKTTTTKNNIVYTSKIYILNASSYNINTYATLSKMRMFLLLCVPGACVCAHIFCSSSLCWQWKNIQKG